MLRPKKVPKEDKPFTRRSRPTPQATRLLFTSSMAGVLLIIVLAVVFIPRGLDWEGRQAPRVTLQFVPSPVPVDPYPAVINVTSVSAAVPLSRFEAEILRDGTPLVNRTALASLPGFTDTDGNGLLSQGDYVGVSVSTGRSYVFVLYHLPSSARIAHFRFP